MWGRKRKPVTVPDDTGEAQVIRQESQWEMQQLREQSEDVASVARKLKRRRELNHFGEELTVSFRPRGGHA